MTLNMAVPHSFIYKACWFSLSTKTEKNWKQRLNQKWRLVCGCALSYRVANILTGPCGLSAGDHVIVMLPKIPHWWLLNIACARAGMIHAISIIIIITLL